MAGDTWKELLELARWAPSPHNVQPWLLRPLHEREADLLYLPDRLLPDTDVGGLFMTSGLGIFVEHLAIAARGRGLDLAVEYDGRELDPHAEGPQPFARLRLVEANVHQPLEPHPLVERRTSRLPYDGKPVPEDVLREIADIARVYGHTFSFSADPGT